jgi:predicted nucleic acid-binding protein
LYRANSDIVDSISRINRSKIAVSDVTCAELFFGARNKQELENIDKDLKSLTVFPIQSEISTIAIDLLSTYCLPHRLDFPDALIAATAIYHNVEIFTLNIRDFIFLPEVKIFR